jgi:hypothetical protein
VGFAEPLDCRDLREKPARAGIDSPFGDKLIDVAGAPVQVFLSSRCLRDVRER